MPNRLRDNNGKFVKGHAQIGGFQKGHTGHKYWLGKRHSEETKRKISQAKKGQISWWVGKKFSPQHIENLKISHANQRPSKETIEKIRVSLTGKKKSPKHVEKVRQALIGRPNYHAQGENNVNWRGGITSLRSKIYHSLRYKIWRRQAMERDSYSCCKCARHGVELNVDHITPFWVIMERNRITTYEQALGCKELWDLENAQTLCVGCHSKTESYKHKPSLYERETIRASAA